MKHARGFTLVEAAVAIGVVAVLAGIIIPLVLKNLEDARRARARNDIQIIAAAIASQMRDTGNRPRRAVGPAAGPPHPLQGMTGVGDAVWVSGGALPAIVPAAGAGAAPVPPFPPPAQNTFENLFATGPGDPQQLSFHLFNILLPAQGNLRYRGPYLGLDMARKTDPWGRAYLIIGYNLNSQGAHGPVWVVSAGEAGTIARANLDPANGGVAAWSLAGASETNIAVRVN